MTPTLQALGLVESVTLDPTTGRVNLTGLFDEVRVPPGADSVSGGLCASPSAGSTAKPG